MIQESIPGLLKNGIPVTESDKAMNTTLENKAKKKRNNQQGILKKQQMCHDHWNGLAIRHGNPKSMDVQSQILFQNDWWPSPIIGI